MLDAHHRTAESESPVTTSGHSERVTNHSALRERPVVGAGEHRESSSWGDRSDEALIAGVACHREAAYAELYRRHVVSVAAVARMIVGNVGYEEVVDDVFVALWLSPADFDPARGSLLGFLRLRAKCHGIDVIRSENSRARREERESCRERVAVIEIESALLDSERAAELRRAVGWLPPVERDAIRLAFFEGMTYQAVAVHLNVAEGTLRSRIRNGLRRLSTRDELRAHRELPAAAALDGT
jgi:RNA polymerase sigma-70 factor (ECF subfamily)